MSEYLCYNIFFNENKCSESVNCYSSLSSSKKQSLRASSPFKKNASIQKGQTFIADSSLTFIFWELVWTQPKKKRAYLFPSLCHKQNLTLVWSVCETVPKSLFWVPTCVPGFEYEPWLACEKATADSPIRLTGNSKCNSGNSLSLYRGPRIKILGLLLTHY